jgi:hypothetical protein
MHTADPLVPETSSFEFESGIEKLERYNASGTDQISAQLLQAGGNTLYSEIQKLSNSIWNKEALRTATAVEGTHYCTYL